MVSTRLVTQASTCGSHTATSMTLPSLSATGTARMLLVDPGLAVIGTGWLPDTGLVAADLVTACTERVADQFARVPRIQLAAARLAGPEAAPFHRRRLDDPESSLSPAVFGCLLCKRGSVLAPARTRYLHTVSAEPLSRPAASRPEGLALTTAVPGLPVRHNGVGSPPRGS